MKKKELKIEYLAPGALKPYANNAKLHPATQIEQIKKSIEQFGFNDPIAIWGDDTIIEGHGRLIAALELEIDKIPVIRLDGLTDEQRRAYSLVHNKLTMNSGFDLDLLDEELESITDIDMEDFGFLDDEKDYFLPDPDDKDMLGEYDEHGDEFLMRKRVIITFLPEREADVRRWLGLSEDEKMKIVYDIDELGIQ